MKLDKHNVDISIVLFAGALWSFGALIVRNLENPSEVAWQYLLFRGLTVFIFLNIFLFIKEGKSFIKNYFHIGISGCLGGIGIALAAIGFILSLTSTSAANTLLMLAVMPFITAILAYIFLREKVSITTWISIAIASIGIIFMAYNNTDFNDFLGIAFGLLSSLGFAMFAVTLRWKKDTPKFTTVALGGLFCFIISLLASFFSESDFVMNFKNSSLSTLHGFLVCSGFVLFTAGSRNLPAAELTLLSLTEVLGGVFWVWLPIFGINEVPSASTIIGGFIITISIVYYSFFTQKKRHYIGLS